MSTPEPLNPGIPRARRLARKFTPQTPFHHPHLDPNVRTEDLQLIPAALFPGRKLNWELPRPAVTDLHVILKLRDNPDELVQDFHDKIPQIEDVLGLWSKVKGAGPTTTGEEQIRADGAQTSVAEEGEDTIFNLVSDLDPRGRGNIIYITDVAKDNGEHAEASRVPSNLRTTEWLGFDGSSIHLADSESKMAAFPMEQGSDIDEHSMRRNSTPFNLRAIEWLDGE